MGQQPGNARVEAVRRFNRYYTRQIGLLQEGLLDGPFSLTEVRVLYELAQRTDASAADLGRELGLDAGYLSRLLRGFQRRRLVATQSSPHDARRRVLRLTVAGGRAFAALDARASTHAAALLAPLSDPAQRRLADAMLMIERLLGGGSPQARRTILLRDPQAGDFGWVVHRHGVLYAREYGWDRRFEALVSRVVADFAAGHDSARERCWMAELDGEVVGSVFLARDSDAVARLRLLLVEPAARGLGIGRQLIHQCIGFARHAGYTKLILWTNSVLHSARHLYESAGFHLVAEEPHDHFGRNLIGETWELALNAQDSA